MEGKKMPETIGTVLDRIEAQQAMALQLGPDAISLDLLRAVYRNPSLPLPVRIRAAGLALPHEVPKLAVTAVVNDQDFATLLDQRIEKMRLIEANGSAKPTTNGKSEGVEVKPPLPRVADRRFRRI